MLLKILLTIVIASSTAGFSYKQLKKSALKKIKKNIKRTWERQSDGTFQHVKTKS